MHNHIPDLVNNFENSMTQTQKLVVIPALAGLMILGGAVAGYAQLSSANEGGAGIGFMRGMMGGRDEGHGIHGTITAINGSTLTVDVDGTAYTVNVDGAEFHTFADGEVSDATQGDLAVGDSIGVRGEVDGTTVEADHVMEGDMKFGDRGGMRGEMRGGRGVMGEVTKVDGNTITVEGRNGKTYTVNATEAEVLRTVEGSVSDIKEGSRIGIHGDVDGTTVTAERIMTDLPEALERN